MLNNLPPRWTVHGQLEEGSNGTKHWQLLLKTPTVRFHQVKQVFGRAHIELARDPIALARYVHKADTRVDDLPPKLAKDVFMNLVCKRALELMEADNNRRIPTFDRIVTEMIYDGMAVEYMGCSAINRMCWKNYAPALIQRHVNHNADETDSVEMETIKDADDNQGSREAEGILERIDDDEEDEASEQDTEQESDEGSEDGSETSSSID